LVRVTGAAVLGRVGKLVLRRLARRTIKVRRRIRVPGIRINGRRVLVLKRQIVVGGRVGKFVLNGLARQIIGVLRLARVHDIGITGRRVIVVKRRFVVGRRVGKLVSTEPARQIISVPGQACVPGIRIRGRRVIMVKPRFVGRRHRYRGRILIFAVGRRTLRRQVHFGLLGRIIDVLVGIRPEVINGRRCVPVGRGRVDSRYRQ
jgi:hypothetical protein